MKAPIVITVGGDVITHYPESDGLNDDAKLDGQCFGVHLICGSFVDCKPTSCSASAILCRGCHLRVEIPLFITTTGDLRKHFGSLQPPTGWAAPPIGTRIVCARAHWPYRVNDCGTIVERPNDHRKHLPPYLTAVKFDALKTSSREPDEISMLRAGMIGPYGAFIEARP